MQGNPTLVEVMSYLPPAMGSDQLMMERQNTNDLAKAIAKSHQDNLKYAKKIAFLFRGYDDKETARNIFNFIKKYIPYTIEPGERQCTKTLPRMLDDARNGIGSDCKMYSVLTGTILKTLKIPFKYRLAGYSTNYPQHIYCKTDKYTIDAVLPHFNYEKPYNYKKDMALYNLAGTDQIGKWVPKTDFGKAIRKATDKLQEKGEELKDAIKKAGNDALKGAKKYGLAPSRQAFLGLLSINFRGLANRADRIYKKDPQKLIDFWVKKFGGDWAAFRRGMEDGIKKKPFLGGKVSGVDTIGIDPATLAAIKETIVAATPIILGLLNLFGSVKGKDDDKDLPSFDLPPPGAGGKDLTDEEKDKIIDDTIKNETSESTINPLYIVGAGAVALFLLTKKSN